MSAFFLQFPFVFYGAAGALIFTILAARELVHACRAPSVGPERGMHAFTALMFGCFAAVLLCGAVRLDRHRAILEQNFPVYPSARYAPERESFAVQREWIYLTHNDAEQVVAFYRATASRAGYALVVNDATGTARLLFARDDRRIFLTITDEGATRVLYYTQEGDVRIVSR